MKPKTEKVLRYLVKVAQSHQGYNFDTAVHNVERHPYGYIRKSTPLRGFAPGANYDTVLAIRRKMYENPELQKQFVGYLLDQSGHKNISWLNQNAPGFVGRYIQNKTLSDSRIGLGDYSHGLDAGAAPTRYPGFTTTQDRMAMLPTSERNRRRLEDAQVEIRRLFDSNPNFKQQFVDNLMNQIPKDQRNEKVQAYYRAKEMMAKHPVATKFLGKHPTLARFVSNGALDQGLDIHGAVLDELGFHKYSPARSSLVNGAFSNRT